MINNLFFYFGMLLFFTSFTIPEKVNKKANKVMLKFYDVETISKNPVAISDSFNAKTLSEFGKENLFEILSNGKRLGYGYIGNAPSKTATFDYLVLFDENFIITKSKVLIYREEYGGEIGSKRWLKQFSGANPESSELVYNQDIIPISGATISVRSMTKAMNELLQSLAILQQANML